jgi:hypothetical protein
MLLLACESTVHIESRIFTFKLPQLVNRDGVLLPKKKNMNMFQNNGEGGQFGNFQSSLH